MADVFGIILVLAGLAAVVYLIVKNRKRLNREPQPAPWTQEEYTEVFNDIKQKAIEAHAMIADEQIHQLTYEELVRRYS